MLSHPALRRRGVAAGYVLAVSAVAATAYLIGTGASLVPTAWLGFLGVVPLGLGLWLAIRRLIGSRREDERDLSPAGGSFFSAVGVTLASSADSLVVYAVLFADTRPGLDVPVLATLVACAVLWVGVARFALEFRAIGELGVAPPRTWSRR